MILTDFSEIAKWTDQELDDIVSFVPNKDASGIKLCSNAVEFNIMDDVMAPMDTSTMKSDITPINQSLNLRKALDGVDDLIIKLKNKKKLISLDQEGYKDIMALYSEIIRDLIDYKDLLCNSNLEDN